MNCTSSEKPITTNRQLLSHNSNIFYHSRISSGTSSASSLFDEYRTNSSEDNASMSINNTTFGINSSSPLHWNMEWNMEDVVTWLESVDLESVVDKFIGKFVTSGSN